jgi:urease accessory protein
MSSCEPQTKLAPAFSGAPAFAYHLMGGLTPATFGEGILSGHPVIGLDHFAAVAVGCLGLIFRRCGWSAPALLVLGLRC